MAGSVTLVDHNVVGAVRSFKVYCVGDIATGAVPATTLSSLGLSEVSGKLLAIATKPRAAATAITLANPSAAADDIVDTSTAHGFVSGTPIRFKTLTGGAGLAIDTLYYVTATSLGTQTFRPATTLGGSAINFTTDITAGTVTSDMFDPPTDNYDITLLDAEGADRLNGVGVDRDTANAERVAVTGAPYIVQGEDMTITVANQSAKCGAFYLTVTYMPVPY